MSDWLKRLLAPVFAAVICLLIWEDIVRLLDVPPYVLPAPTDVFDVLLNGGERSVALFKGAYQTALAASLGFLIAAIVGVTLGTLLASVGVLKRGLYPLANLLQMVPIIALAPLLNIWFGYGIAGVAASACIVAIFPVIASTVDGLGAIDPHHRELFDLYRASAPQRWRLLGLKSALPQICTGLRVSAGLAVIGAVVGELVSGVLDTPPLGAIIAAALRNSALDLVFGAVVLSALIGFGLFALVSGLGHMALSPWHPSTRRPSYRRQGGRRAQIERRLLLVFCCALTGLTTWALLKPDLRRESARIDPSAASQPARSAGLPQTPVRIQLNWVPEPEFGGLYEALLKGYFKDEGLNVTLIKGGPGIASPQLVATGQVEFAIVSGAQVVTMREKGAPIVAVYANFDQFVRGLAVRSDSTHRSLQQIWMSDGKLGVEAGLPFVRWLEHIYGPTRRTMVQTGGSLVEFKRDPHMAQGVFVFAEPIALELDGVKTEVMAVSKSGFNPYSVVLATNDRYAAAHPAVIKAVQRALARGWQSYLTHPKSTNRHLAKLNPAMSLDAMNLAAAKIAPYVRGESRRLGEMQVERWSVLIEQLETIGVINKRPQAKDCFVASDGEER
ncbi:MAG: ABC transporter substrate-binding protein [Bradymonadia bacterium]